MAHERPQVLKAHCISGWHGEAREAAHVRPEEVEAVEHLTRAPTQRSSIQPMARGARRPAQRQADQTHKAPFEGTLEAHGGSALRGVHYVDTAKAGSIFKLKSRYVATVAVASRISAVVLPPSRGCVLCFQIHVCPGSGLSYQS